MAQSTDLYGYLPSKPAAIFGIAYFGTAVLICITQIIFGKHKHYWMFTVALAAAGEAIGWGGRLWAHSEPENWMPFMIQICSLIISPVFISAADYVLFCKIVENAGKRLFYIPSKLFWIWFIILDIISLAIQTVGGVFVSGAQNYDQLNHGSSVMRSGIIFQFSNTFIFVILIVGAIFRVRMKGIWVSSVAGWPAMIAMWVSTLMVFIRNAYRIAELSGGWKGHLMRTEWYLVALDMVPMAMAVAAFVVFSPSLFFYHAKPEKEGKPEPLSDCISLSWRSKSSV